MPSPDSQVHRYHDGTKHAFNRFARSLGYLDWASQPNPFRSFPGARIIPLHPAPGALVPSYAPVPVSYDRLSRGQAEPQPIHAATLGDFLRHALGLSAWKQYGKARWSLRVNPSSGNLHPTEAYVVSGALPGISDRAGVYHYAPDRHALEERCAFDGAAWSAVTGGSDVVLVALTSIIWREAWKYGERAFRYCQHDLGHAIAALAASATLFGWRVRIVPSWSARDVARLTGNDRDQDFVDVEREDPGPLLAVGPSNIPRSIDGGAGHLHAAVNTGFWTGQASLLSGDHVQWTFIDEVAAATEDPGRASREQRGNESTPDGGVDSPTHGERVEAGEGLSDSDARGLILQRRSAVAFDGVGEIPAEIFYRMLASTLPGAEAPWSLMWWKPRIHFLLFVHRVRGVEPGLYLFGRDPEGFARLHHAIDRESTEPVHATLPLVRLAAGDCRALARRLSCDQDIAADGFFSLGMIAEFKASLAEHGAAFYRHLFWESGVVGQVLYLAAEAAGARATGIGCFYDDPVHDALGLTSHAFQSLYHFTVGRPVEDTRLTVESGYAWER